MHWQCVPAILLITTVSGGPEVFQCLQAYQLLIRESKPDPDYMSFLKSYVDVLKIPRVKKPHKLILDVGLRSLDSSQVFLHMIQMGIHGNNVEGNHSSHCKLEHGNSPFHDIGPQRFYVHPRNTVFSPQTLSWLEFIDQYPNSVFVNSDITTSEYLSYLKSGDCNVTLASNGVQQSPLCYLPYLHVGNGSVGFQPRIEDHLQYVGLDRVGIVAAAYRDLIACAVPKERLFTFNLDEIGSKDYWSRLFSFVSPNMSTLVVDRLTRGGKQAQLTTNDICRGRSCPFKEVRPNVCRVDAEMPLTLPSKMQSCATQYADEIGLIFGWKYRDLILEKLMEPPGGVRSASRDTNRIIMEVGPGSTGTRTLHFAMIHLNISALHYRLESRNCTGHKYEHGMDGNIKLLHDDPDPHHQILWSDTPAIAQWWYVLQMYPNTRIVMTDVRNETEWMIKREREHCHKDFALFRRPHWDVSCTVPLPVDFLVPSRLSKQFYEAVKLSRVSFDDHQRSWNAYRKLVKCVVPEKQLWWLYMKEQTSAEKFWSTMFEIARLPSIDPTLSAALVDAGVPLWSSQGCFRGATRCNYTGKFDPMVAPSVCSFALNQTQQSQMKFV